MDIPRVLERIGVLGQDMGNQYDTYEHFAESNRFTVPIPTEQVMLDTWAILEAEDVANIPILAREAEYRELMSNDNFMEAYFEREYESKPEKMDALQVEREKVKIKYPKE